MSFSTVSVLILNFFIECTWRNMAARNDESASPMLTSVGGGGIMPRAHWRAAGSLVRGACGSSSHRTQFGNQEESTDAYKHTRHTPESQPLARLIYTHARPFLTGHARPSTLFEEEDCNKRRTTTTNNDDSDTTTEHRTTNDRTTNDKTTN